MDTENYATIEILKSGEVILGSTPSCRYMVREFEGDEEIGAEFFDTILEAERHVLIFQGENRNEN